METAKFLRRQAASDYLRAKWGLSFTPGTLAKLCSQGRGPAAHRSGRIALHSPEALDAWVVARIKAPAPKSPPRALHSLHRSALAEMAVSP
jgi:hypothetical protein